MSAELVSLECDADTRPHAERFGKGIVPDSAWAAGRSGTGEKVDDPAA
jgi:hypothetical protein